MSLATKCAICAVIFVSMGFFSTTSFAQLPNGGFENWSAGSPVGWVTDNESQDTTIIQTKDAHSGTYAVEGRVVAVGGSGFSPLLTAVFAISNRPSNLTGYIKFNRGGTDTLIIAAFLLNDTSTVAFGTQTITNNITSYTQLQIPLNYFSNAVPDSGAVTIQVRPYFGSNVGTAFYADDFSFTGISFVEASAGNSLPGTYTLGQNYPNPFNPATQITFSIARAGFVTLKVYDMLGREVATLVNQELAQSSYSIPWNAAGVPSGVYFYKLDTGNYSLTKKMVLMK